MSQPKKNSKITTPETLDQWFSLILPYLPPPSLAAISSTCHSLHLSATSITSRRSSDAARGLETHPIPFLNPSHSPPYSYFLYSPFPFSSPPSSSQPWGSTTTSSSPSVPVSPPPADFISGCDCSDCGDACGCCCSGFDGGGEMGMGSLRECGPGCVCGLECCNRRTQRGIMVRLKIVWGLEKGWGLHADQPLRRGEFVCVYAGEFVTTKEARRRLHAYDELASTSKVSPALLVVREHLPSGKACLRVNIDATSIGNVARFINHSCDGGNLMTVLVRDSGSFLPRLCFFAAVDISEGEELTFSYGNAHFRQKDSPCFCRKEACLGFLPSEET